MAAETITLSRQQLHQYCCVDLIKAEVDGLIATASGGVWIGHADGCLNHLPKARFCPFCGADIIARYDEVAGFWSWHIRPRPEVER